MTSPEPNIGVILARIEALTKAQENTAAQLAALVSTLEDRYVPRREFELRVGEVEKDVNAQTSFRRQVAAGALVGVIVLIANLVVTLTRIPGAGA